MISATVEWVTINCMIEKNRIFAAESTECFYTEDHHRCDVWALNKVYFGFTDSNKKGDYDLFVFFN